MAATTTRNSYGYTTPINRWGGGIAGDLMNEVGQGMQPPPAGPSGPVVTPYQSQMTGYPITEGITGMTPPGYQPGPLVPGGFNPMDAMSDIYARGNNFDSWLNDDWRGSHKSWLENQAFPLLEMARDFRGQDYEQRLGGFNAYQAMILNQASIRAMEAQQQRENRAMGLGQQRWESEFGEAGRQFDVGADLTREGYASQEGIATAGNLSQERIAGGQNAAAMERLMSQLGFSREELAQAESQFGRQLGFQERELGQQESQFGRQLGFSREELAQAESQFGRQLSQRESEYGRELGQRESEFGRTLGFQERELGQQAAQFGRSASLAERESEQRYGVSGLEAQRMAQTQEEGAATRALQDRMQQRQLRTAEDTERRRLEVERERIRSQENQSRWAQFGRAQTPNTTWARNWG